MAVIRVSEVRHKERQRLVAAHVHHPAVPERPVKPGADRAVHVLARREGVLFLIEADEDTREGMESLREAEPRADDR